jgi:hypothetical protein
MGSIKNHPGGEILGEIPEAVLSACRDKKNRLT